MKKIIPYAVLFVVVLTNSSIDSRTMTIRELEKEIQLLQVDINSINRTGLYKYELVPGYQWPIKEIHNAYITSGFESWRYHGGRNYIHHAYDLSRKGETWIHSAKSGIVIETGNSYTMGKYVIVEHTKSITKYYHLEKVTVKKYDIVDCNTVLGKMGNTGKWSRGRHLHWEYWPLIDGKYVLGNIVLGKKDRGNYWE